MGNDNCCASERKIRKSAFTETERAVLKDLYSDLVSKSSSKAKPKISADALASLFPENPILGNLLLSFFVANAKDKDIEFEIFEATLEILVKEPTDFQYKEYRSMEKIDVLALLVAGDYETSKEELKYQRINEKDAAEFARIILRIFNNEAPSKKNKLDDSTVNNLVNNLFSNNEKVTWWSLISYTKQNLIYINRVLKFYWTNKFLKTRLSIKLPELNQESKVLSKENLGLIFLSNQFFQAITKVEIVYSSMVSNITIKEIADLLCNIKGPHLILIKYTAINPKSKELVPAIFGGFSRLKWENGGVYGGDSDCYITQFYPKFRNYFASLHEHATNHFTYINTVDKTKPIGLGFGGANFENFRFFFDGRDPSSSYFSNDDTNYDNGPIFEGKSNKVKVEYIEVWGFGTEYTVKESKKIDRKSVITNQTRPSFIDPKDLEFKPSSTAGNSTPYKGETDNFIQNRLSQIAKERVRPTYERTTQIVRTRDAMDLTGDPEPEPPLRSETAENVLITEDFEDGGNERTKKSGKPKNLRSGAADGTEGSLQNIEQQQQQQPRYSKHAYIKTARNFEVIEVGDKEANLDRKSAILLNNSRVNATTYEPLNPKGSRSTIGGYYDPFKQQNVEYAAENVPNNGASGMAQDF